MKMSLSLIALATAAVGGLEGHYVLDASEQLGTFQAGLGCSALMLKPQISTSNMISTVVGKKVDILSEDDRGSLSVKAVAYWSLYEIIVNFIDSSPSEKTLIQFCSSGYEPAFQNNLNNKVYESESVNALDASSDFVEEVIRFATDTRSETCLRHRQQRDYDSRQSLRIARDTYYKELRQIVRKLENDQKIRKVGTAISKTSRDIMTKLRSLTARLAKPEDDPTSRWGVLLGNSASLFSIRSECSLDPDPTSSDKPSSRADDGV